MPIFVAGKEIPKPQNWEVEEMGWAFFSLEPWKQYVIWNHFTMRREEWETFHALGYDAIVVDQLPQGQTVLPAHLELRHALGHLVEDLLEAQARLEFVLANL